MSEYQLVVGDCREAMRAMADASVDAIVTDPPYGLTSNRKGRSPATEGAVMRGFMGMQWDGSVPDVAVFAEMYRVLKDGGRLLCFGGSRTHHRMWCNIEDAGFVLEDTIMWIYGQGFPKHKSKLKPSYEPICVARKGGVSELNIDACRIGFASGADERESKDKNRHGDFASKPRGTRGIYGADNRDQENYDKPGRWPANVALDAEAARLLDEMSGIEKSGTAGKRTDGGGMWRTPGHDEWGTYGDTGGASRFFYVAKASRAEREHGLEGGEKRNGGSTAKGFTDDVERGQDRNRPVLNNHPTVKPVDLMRWLVRLVTQPGQTVLDPFMGSGTTGIAAIQEGRNFVGIELNPQYVEIARRRIGSAPLSLFANPDGAA